MNTYYCSFCNNALTWDDLLDYNLINFIKGTFYYYHIGKKICCKKCFKQSQKNNRFKKNNAKNKDTVLLHN